MSSDKKTAVVSALEELGNAFGVLRKAHGTAQTAILEYAQAIDHTANPSELLAQFPSLLGGLIDSDEKVKKPKAPSPEVDASGEPKKRKRGPNKEKKVKDPNAPKRPPSAYIEYQNSVREEFRKQFPNAPYAEVLKKIGLVWQSMSDSDKKPWNDITAAKKVSYDQEKEVYDAQPQTGGPVATPAAAAAAAPTEEDQKTPYTGKKRGRKSNAEKKAMADAAAAVENGRAGDIPVEDPKEKKKVKAASPKAKRAPTPEDDSDDESGSGSDEDSEEEESSSESEEETPAPPAKQPKKDKHKSKKAKQ
ncbi:hypothetical protein JCM11641_007498 [Rhodosporidiobolus odoratus]